MEPSRHSHLRSPLGEILAPECYAAEDERNTMDDWQIALLVGGLSAVVMLILFVRRDRKRSIRFAESLGLECSSFSPMICSGVHQGLAVRIENLKLQAKTRGVMVATRVQIDDPPTPHVTVIQKNTFDSPDQVDTSRFKTVRSRQPDFDDLFRIYVEEDSASAVWTDPERCAIALRICNQYRRGALWEMAVSRGRLTLTLAGTDLHTELLRMALDLAVDVAQIE